MRLGEFETMKRLLALIATLAIAIQPVAAEDQASEASVRDLLEVTQSRRLLDGLQGQMDAFIKEAMGRALAGKTPTVEQQAILDEFRAKLVALFQEEMKWELLEPRFIEIYRQSFTEQEIAGMLEFYRTAAGQAVISKMPVVMQHSMALMQEMMISVSPKLRALQAEALEKLDKT
jgi:uncharacterized protein